MKKTVLTSFRRIKKSTVWFMIYSMEAQGTFPPWSIDCRGILIWS